MEKDFRTFTFGSKNRLQLDITSPDKLGLLQKGVEVKARVDLDTGEVKFFVDEEALKKLRTL